MSQLPPDQTGIVSDPSLNYGLAPTSQAQTFETEEAEAGAARGGANPLTGWKLPAGMAGDFWNLYSQAEQFAANTGWKYLPTPKQLQAAWIAGAASWSTTQLFSYFATATGVNQTSMPWAATGLNATQYGQQIGNLNDTVYGLTGKGSWAAAGLDPATLNTALTQGWSSQRIQDYIQQNPALNKQYGYLAQGYNYQTFQNYKAQNAQGLKARYGNSFTDQQAIASLAAPESTFHASGGAFGQYQPYTQSTTKIATGLSSAVR
jgi:hypothetical protein